MYEAKKRKEVWSELLHTTVEFINFPNKNGLFTKNVQVLE